jgi:hypothetical protein
MQFLPQLALHAHRRHRPQRGVEIDLGPFGKGQLTGAQQERGASLSATRTTGVAASLSIAHNSSPNRFGSVMAGKCVAWGRRSAPFKSRAGLLDALPVATA